MIIQLFTLQLFIAVCLYFIHVKNISALKNRDVLYLLAICWILDALTNIQIIDLKDTTYYKIFENFLYLHTSLNDDSFITVELIPFLCIALLRCFITVRAYCYFRKIYLTIPQYLSVSVFCFMSTYVYAFIFLCLFAKDM